jgi:hypothetical protein
MPGDSNESRDFRKVRASVQQRPESCVEMHVNQMQDPLQVPYTHRPYPCRHSLLRTPLKGHFEHFIEYYNSLYPVTPSKSLYKTYPKIEGTRSIVSIHSMENFPALLFKVLNPLS